MNLLIWIAAGLSLIRLFSALLGFVEADVADVYYYLGNLIAEGIIFAAFVVVYQRLTKGGDIK